jgi:hypothetical protein
MFGAVTLSIASLLLVSHSALAATASASSARSSSGDFATANCSIANDPMYFGPDFSSGIVARCPLGERVTVYCYTGSFYQVESGLPDQDLWMPYLDNFSHGVSDCSEDH